MAPIEETKEETTSSFAAETTITDSSNTNSALEDTKTTIASPTNSSNNISSETNCIDTTVATATACKSDPDNSFDSTTSNPFEYSITDTTVIANQTGATMFTEVFENKAGNSLDSGSLEDPAGTNNEDIYSTCKICW